MSSFRTRALLGFVAASVAVGLANAPLASADVKTFNECIRDTPNPAAVVKQCCAHAGGTYGGGGSPTAEETCTFNGNALSPESATEGSTPPNKVPVRIVTKTPTQAQVRS